MNQFPPKRGPGRPRKDSFDRSKAITAEIVRIKSLDPDASAMDIAKKLGLAESTARKYLARSETKAQVEAVRARVLDAIAERHLELVREAVEQLASCLTAIRVPGVDLATRLNACKFILGPIFDRLADQRPEGDIEFTVVVEDDGTITQRVRQELPVRSSQ